MIQFTKGKGIFITYEKRSVDKYWPLLSAEVRQHFGDGPFVSNEVVKKILFFCYDWIATKFLEIIHTTDDVNFALYLFGNHEASIDLYKRRLAGENLQETENINENDLALNRRVLKLALEQTCDVDYSQEADVKQMLQQYVSKVEDLLYLGSQLFGFAENLSENRMIEDCHQIIFNENKILQIERKHHYEHVYEIMNEFFEDGFKEGIVNTAIVNELVEKLKECMGIDYNFAGGLIFQIKAHHSPEAPQFQTVEPAILPQNLINAGVEKNVAENFYNGLTISRSNKLKITDAIYRVNAFERHMFRPILIINFKGVDRALVGESKWAESIVVMATNGFQWQRAPAEWLHNKCFKEFLQQKALEHDKHLEHEVEKKLTSLEIPFCRNILSFTDSKGASIRVDVEGIGEMDFVFVDENSKKIIVADCKYNRARYEMVGFSTDYKNFETQYEPKLQRKIDWVSANRALVQEHFERVYPNKKFEIQQFSVEGLFIINTPTFYMMNGKYKTINISRFIEFIRSAYEFPIIRLQSKGNEAYQDIRHPYFKVQQ
jgi:hypothetical protein